MRDDHEPAAKSVRSFPVAVPLFLPGVALSIILGTLLAVRLARILRTHPAVAWLMLVSLGIVVAATLTPLLGALARGTQSSGTCDLSRLGLAPLSLYLRPNETSANVALFVPLGVAIGLLPRGNRFYACLAMGLALPLVIETTQLLLPVLSRGCQSADVVDNHAGLLLGLIVGVGLGRLQRHPDHRSQPN